MSIEKNDYENFPFSGFIGSSNARNSDGFFERERTPPGLIRLMIFMTFYGLFILGAYLPKALESSSPSTSKSCCVASRSARYTTEAPHKDKRVIPAAFLKFAELLYKACCR